ncbi:MAG: tail fiber domain-containing protein [Planctomycetota bacterium]|jgi:hypothetical protein
MRRAILLAAVMAGGLLASPAPAQIGQGTAFTYQGSLTIGGEPAVGPFNMQFSAWDDAVGGNLVGGPVIITGVPVQDGLFMATIDFGPGVFDGDARWLQIEVQPAVGGPFILLDPRQRLTPSPSAIHAESAAAATTGSFRIVSPSALVGPGSATLLFGPTDLCRIRLEPDVASGLIIEDPFGARVLNPVNAMDSGLFFGLANECRLGLHPDMVGLILEDPNGARVLNPLDPMKSLLRFGPTDECSIGLSPDNSGLIVVDPFGLRVLNEVDPMKSVLRFGMTDECTIGLSPDNSGLIVVDPFGLRVLNPMSEGPAVLSLGAGECFIGTNLNGPNTGMIFTDPAAFGFMGGNIGVNLAKPATAGLQLPNIAGDQGTVLANMFQEYSSRRWKRDVRLIADPLQKLQRLEGVSFRWDEAHGGQLDLGFIAEDVGDVLPELVAWEDDGVYARSLSYDRIVAVAVEGIKAQQKQIDSLAAANAQLESELDLLKSQYASLARRIAELERSR